MSRSYVLIICEMAFVTVICVIAAILFRRQPPPVASAVNVEVKLPDSQAHVFLDRQEGKFAYLIQRSDGSQERLSPEEIAAFQKNNQAYREKFGFPFVICARLNKRDAILKGFETRLKNSRAQEIQAALEEIGKIASLRLQDIVAK